MNANLNQGVWKAMENRWAEALSQVRQVEVEVDVVYEDVSTSLLEIIPDGSAKIIASSWVGDDWAKTKIRFEDASRKRWSLCFEGCTEAGDR